MHMKQQFDSNLFDSYLEKLRTTKTVEKRNEIIRAVTSWVDWLRNKNKISDRKYNALLKLIEDTNVSINVEDNTSLKASFPKEPLSLYIIITLIAILSLTLNLYFFLQVRSFSLNNKDEDSIGRVLPFRGTIKETDGSPLDTKRDVSFSLYSSINSEDPIYEGHCTGESGIEPSFNGNFSILIGADCGMEPIPEEVFATNTTLYLGVKIGSEPELQPRYQIFTSSFSKDTSKLQGMDPGTEESSIPFINEKGEIVFENDSPTLKATNGIFTVEGKSLTLSSTQEEGNIILDPAIGGNLILGSGRFGLGTFNPQATLDVAGSSILNSLVTFSNLTKEDSPNASVLKLSLGTMQEGENSEFISFYSNVSGDNAGVKVGGIRLNNSGVAYETSGADFAEYFEVDDPSVFKKGHIVALTNDGIIPAQGAPHVIGIVSDSAGFIGNIKVKEGSILVGMVGQVEVLVSTINGEIQVGNIVGPSLIPGYGSKVTDVNNRVGLSLENSESKYFTNEQCPIPYRGQKDVKGDVIKCGLLKLVINLD